MSDFLNPAGSAQPATVAVQPPVSGALSGTVPPGGASLVSMPEPSNTTPIEMPTGAMPSGDLVATSTESFDGLPAGQMVEPGPGQLGEMPKGEMSEQ